MNDILATIDAATGCQQCGGPLGDSPSDDFCRERCRMAWYAAGVQILSPDEGEAFRTFDLSLFDNLRTAFEEFGRALMRMQAELAKISEVAAKPDMNPRERALHLRRTRNTGPALPPLGRR